MQISWKEPVRKHSEGKEAAFSGRVARMGAVTKWSKVHDSNKHWWNFLCCVV